MEKKDDIRDRLFKVTSDFKVISDFNESQRDEKESQFFEKREHLRKNVSIFGIFETVNEQFRVSTKNVSMGGVLIDSETHLSLYEDLNMTFIDSKFNGHVRTKGKVIRIDSGGVGIQFDKVIPVMSSL
ncbi:MAG: PilZ domain-containing protein [Deltaproteobacteria bacterium]|nr:PilZ domain-containing protein [Deltaproteobacteria bacterium]MBW2681919.1 PilZ domain-containing protein [Deltaproteobacteria bacterium]